HDLPIDATHIDRSAVVARDIVVVHHISFTVDNEQPLRLGQALRLPWSQHRLVIVPVNVQRGRTARAEEQQWDDDKHRLYGLSLVKHCMPPLWGAVCCKWQATP